VRRQAVDELVVRGLLTNPPAAPAPVTQPGADVLANHLLHVQASRSG
jgi:hypothetical protein